MISAVPSELPSLTTIHWMGRRLWADIDSMVYGRYCSSFRTGVITMYAIINESVIPDFSG
jgi:hypothetical protein